MALGCGALAMAGLGVPWWHASLPRPAPGGVIVYDNTLRVRYRRAIAATAVAEQRFRGLTAALPYPDQTSMLVAS